jgi:hypothetical protein
MVLRRTRCRRNTPHAEVRSCHLYLSVCHSAFKLGESAKGFENPSYIHKGKLQHGTHPHPAQEMFNKGKCFHYGFFCRPILNLMQGHKPNPPKSTMSDWFLGPTNSSLPTKSVPSPPRAKASPSISSSGCEAATFNVPLLN